MASDNPTSDTDLTFGYSCHACGQQSFRISMDGYQVDKAECNFCGTVTHFTDQYSQDTERDNSSRKGDN